MEIALWHWVGFGILVAVLLALDLLVFHRHDHAPSLRESAGWSVFWITLALAFGGVIWWWDGSITGTKYLTAYLIEKALSMDNIFVFVVIFRFFAIPLMYQYRVLFWGILGAIVMRLAFILAGIELIQRRRSYEDPLERHYMLSYRRARLAIALISLAMAVMLVPDPGSTYGEGAIFGGLD